MSFHWTIVQLRFQVTELILPPLKGVNVNLGGHNLRPPLFVDGSERTLSCLNIYSIHEGLEH